MWLPVIESLEEVMSKSKTESERRLESYMVRDVFSTETLDRFMDAVFVDEKERLTERDWSADNPEDPQTKLYLSLSVELKDMITDMWAYEYAFYAYQLNMCVFNKDFLNYVDIVQGMDEEFEE